MDRRGFLITIFNSIIFFWVKILKPLLLIALVVFCLRFIFNATFQNGAERFIIATLVFIVVISLLFKSLRGFLNRSIQTILSKLPVKIQSFLRVISKIIDFVTPFLLGGMIYHYYRENGDWANILIVSLILLIDKVKEVLKEEKLLSLEK